jgi:hypothetical protein
MRQKFIDTNIFDHFLKDNEDKPIFIAMVMQIFFTCQRLCSYSQEEDIQGSCQQGNHDNG